MESISMFISVKGLSEINGDATHIINGTKDNDDFVRFLDKEYKGLQVTIDYPFNGASFIISKAKSLCDVLKPIADFYKNNVYNEPEKNGVWGHDIDDLYFERIVITDKNEVEVFIGS
jgi:hypothetical protein